MTTATAYEWNNRALPREEEYDGKIYKIRTYIASYYDFTRHARQLGFEVDFKHTEMTKEKFLEIRDKPGNYITIRAYKATPATLARWRKVRLYTRAVAWFFLPGFRAAKARVDFQPGGTGALKAAAEFASTAAKEGPTDDAPPRKRQRTE